MFKYNCEEARNIVADALESGGYTQGTGCLEHDGTNCCLGVATREFMLHEEHEIKIEVDYRHWTGFETGGFHYYATLPKVVQKWLGFTGDCGEYNYGSLSLDNDEGASFSEIAKLFREPPEGLIDAQH